LLRIVDGSHNLSRIGDVFDSRNRVAENSFLVAAFHYAAAPLHDNCK
jgi:hypothetical protein